MKTQLLAFILAASPALAATPIWSDEFNQPEDSAPDPAKWTHALGGGGWGNSELETYTDSRANSFVTADPAATDGKALVIRALKSDAGAYTSARLHTQGKFSTRYGRIEARIKSSNGQGLWPAFWMLGDNIGAVGWPQCGEIDVMEIVGANPTRAYGTLHGPGYSGTGGIGANYTLPNGARYDTAYHVFAVDWSPNKLVWSIDGTVYHTVTPASLPAGTQWVFNDTSFYLLLNLAVGGGWPGNPDATTTFPQTLTVDYVRVYGRQPTPPATVGGYASGRQAITLTWQPGAAPGDSRVTGYRIERARDTGFTEEKTTVDVGPVTSFDDHAVVVGARYIYRVRTVTAEGVSNPSPTVTVQSTDLAGSGPAPLLNIAARAFCGAGNNVTIGGFVVGSGGTKRVLVRAVGPSLVPAGIAEAEVLADPVLELHRGDAIMATNDDWETNANVAELLATSARLGATAFAATDHRSSALLLTVPPGVYTFVVGGRDATSGIVLLETYDAD